MFLITRRALAVLTALILGTSIPVVASVVVPMSLGQLTAAAEVIVDATVVDVHAKPGPDGIERLVQVRVASTWKGQPVSALYVRLAGGRLGRTETRVPGVPSLEEGDRVIWFLVAHPRGGYSVLGLHQGALAAVPTADGSVRILAPALGRTGRGDVSRLPRRLEDLEADVRSLTGTGGPQ